MYLHNKHIAKRQKLEFLKIRISEYCLTVIKFIYVVKHFLKDYHIEQLIPATWMQHEP